MKGRLLITTLILWWVTMFVATHIPGPKLPPTGLNDKTEHYLAYGILSMLLCSVLVQRRMVYLKAAGLTLVICAAYGAFDELTQPYFNRVADFSDWVADVIGAISGIALRGLWEVVALRPRSSA